MSPRFVEYVVYRDVGALIPAQVWREVTSTPCGTYARRVAHNLAKTSGRAVMLEVFDGAGYRVQEPETWNTPANA